ncbi:MAG: pentapeptide repeat-containing protein [Thermodesulfobacteriota bacterium]
MADQEHLKILEKGVAVWNQWREKNPEILPDLREADLSGAALDGIHFCDADLSAAILAGASLEGAYLHRASLFRANLRKTRLRVADLRDAVLSEADLGGSEGRWTDLSRAALKEADLRGSRFHEADFSGAELTLARLEGAELIFCDLEGADVSGVRWDRATKCRGIRAATCYGSPMFKRFAQDQDFVEELQARGKRGKGLYYIWNVFADCGRTPWRWIAWSALFAFYFALNFWLLGPGHIRLANESAELPFSLAAMIYYSVVTFTTLGFGDVTPLTLTAAFWVMAEVILGYVMLGGLISIFATLVARRS